MSAPLSPKNGNSDALSPSSQDRNAPRWRLLTAAHAPLLLGREAELNEAKILANTGGVLILEGPEGLGKRSFAHALLASAYPRRYGLMAEDPNPSRTEMDETLTEQIRDEKVLRALSKASTIGIIGLALVDVRASILLLMAREFLPVLDQVGVRREQPSAGFLFVNPESCSYGPLGLIGSLMEDIPKQKHLVILVWDTDETKPLPQSAFELWVRRQNCKVMHLRKLEATELRTLAARVLGGTVPDDLGKQLLQASSGLPGQAIALLNRWVEDRHLTSEGNPPLWRYSKASVSNRLVTFFTNGRSHAEATRTRGNSGELSRRILRLAALVRGPFPLEAMEAAVKEPLSASVRDAHWVRVGGDSELTVTLWRWKDTVALHGFRNECSTLPEAGVRACRDGIEALKWLETQPAAVQRACRQAEAAWRNASGGTAELGVLGRISSLPTRGAELRGLLWWLWKGHDNPSWSWQDYRQVVNAADRAAKSAGDWETDILVWRLAVDRGVDPGNLSQAGRAYHNLGQAYSFAGQHHRAEKALETALVLGEEGGDSRMSLGRTRHVLGQVLYAVGRLKDAEVELRTALEMKRAGGDSPSSLGVTKHALGQVLNAAGRSGEALRELEEALEQKTTGGDPPSSLGITRHELGRVLHDAGRSKEAEEQLRQALELAQHAGTTSSELGRTRHELGRVLHDTGRSAEAEIELRMALELEEAQGDSPISVGITRHVLGRVLLALGRAEEAEEELRKAIKLKELGKASLGSLSVTQHVLGQVLYAAGRSNEAEMALKKALMLGEAGGGTEESLEITRKLLRRVGESLSEMRAPKKPRAKRKK